MSSVLAPVASFGARRGPVWVVHEALRRQRTLTLFGAAMLVAFALAAIGLGVDDRVLRGMNVWVKPMKFMLSVAVFALTTAWFIGYLPVAQRSNRAVKAVVAMILAAGTFEVGYITLQAALGEASHYNVGDALHGVLYTLMGIGAAVLTASQAVLAWQLRRYRDPSGDPSGDPSLAVPYRAAVVIGLLLTFVLGTGLGFLLGGLQPPTAPAVPVFGWALTGDLRPAHFLSIHAQQVLPLAGAAIAALNPRHGTRWVAVVAVLYSTLTIGLAVYGMATHPMVLTPR